MIEGCRQADLVLVETYTSDWRWDGFITGRWKTAADAGLADRSVAVLGLGSQWIGTEKELRRVFRMIRSRCPEMPGIGFFPDVPKRLVQAVDSAIEDYFLRPVVQVGVKDHRFTVRNIGETEASNIGILFVDSKGNRLSNNRRIALLKAWESISEPLPDGAVSAQIQPAPDRYTTLRYNAPLDTPPPSKTQKLAAVEFLNRIASGKASQPLKPDVAIDHQYDDAMHVRSASVAVDPSDGGPVTLSFSLTPQRCWFYGQNRISLVGEGELALAWSRQDHDAGIDAAQARPMLSFKGKDGFVIRDVPTIGFRENETYRVLMTYDGRKTIRALISDNQGLLWDSDPIEVGKGFNCQRIQFDVNPYPRSAIEINARGVLLRGGGGAADTPYWLESKLSDVKLFYGDRWP